MNPWRSIIVILAAICISGCGPKAINKKVSRIPSPDIFNMSSNAMFRTVKRTQLSTIDGVELKTPEDCKLVKFDLGPPNMALTIAIIYSDSKKVFYEYGQDSLKYSGIPTGAVALGKKHILAVAVLDSIVSGKGVIMEEFHLTPNHKVTYWSRKFISFGGRIKLLKEEGSKKESFFSEWPTDTSYL